ncbi:uncharacterized protein LOC129731618 [Wyeomyia smithii]|uniref:uncharacterized protein LOC129731618 n=1 Tax=Wyeomyia smithii TaxID=174621 RepID=UPI002468046A|nr:uncharacterized protein LOC129731618 [Wyeomyia smithii]
MIFDDSVIISPRLRSVQQRLQVLPEAQTTKVIKMNLLKLNLCLLVLLLIECVNLSNAGYGCKGKHKWNSRRHRDVHIEIYRPKGVMIWYPKHPRVVMFGIQIFLNSPSTELSIGLNTTNVSYGKFILRDDNAIIRARDRLHYTAMMRKIDGSYFNETDEFYVARGRITSRQAECSRGNQAITPNSDVTKLQQKITVLQNVVSDVFQHCNNNTQSGNRLYLNIRLMETGLDPEGLHNYTLNELKKFIPSLDWDTVLIHTEYYGDGIAFEVKTFVDKLLVLQMSKGSGQFTISELDELDEQIADNEIDSYDYGD